MRNAIQTGMPRIRGSDWGIPSEAVGVVPYQHEPRSLQAPYAVRPPGSLPRVHHRDFHWRPLWEMTIPLVLYSLERSQAGAAHAPLLPVAPSPAAPLAATPALGAAPGEVPLALPILAEPSAGLEPCDAELAESAPSLGVAPIEGSEFGAAGVSLPPGVLRYTPSPVEGVLSPVLRCCGVPPCSVVGADARGLEGGVCSSWTRETATKEPTMRLAAAATPTSRKSGEGRRGLLA